MYVHGQVSLYLEQELDGTTKKDLLPGEKVCDQEVNTYLMITYSIVLRIILYYNIKNYTIKIICRLYVMVLNSLFNSIVHSLYTYKYI